MAWSPRCTTTRSTTSRATMVVTSATHATTGTSTGSPSADGGDQPKVSPTRTVAAPAGRAVRRVDDAAGVDTPLRYAQCTGCPRSRGTEGPTGALDDPR